MKTITITDTGKLSTSKLMANLKKTFDVYSYWDDKELDDNFPKPKKSTTRSFAIEQESSDFKGNSWDQMRLSERKDDMMTFREYILFFEAYHKETGKYPDEEGWTVFRDSLRGGAVANGYWHPNDRGVWFDWRRSDDVGPNIGARLAISPSSLNLDTLPTELTINGVVYVKK